MSEPESVNNFDVLKEMSKRDMKIIFAPISNLMHVKKVKDGTKITIGIGGDVIAGIVNNEFCGGMILADREQFHAIKKELEKINAK